MDWVLTMQADDGSVYHKLSTRSFGGFMLPEFETTDRVFHSLGQRSHGGFCGDDGAGGAGFSGLTTRFLPTAA